MGYTAKGLKPCLHPLLAMISEVRLVAQLWLRPGNTACGSNARAFFLDLWGNLPRHIRLRGVRADSGFYLPEGFKDIAAYVVVLVMLVVRPNGLFGEKLRKKV